jgi:hypothetical protein
MSSNNSAPDRRHDLPVPSTILKEWRVSVGRMSRLDDNTAEWDRESRHGMDLAREYQRAFVYYLEREGPPGEVLDRFRAIAFRRISRGSADWADGNLLGQRPADAIRRSGLMPGHGRAG